jgi:CubicO group peptidase (beta-lactamase class C family)
VKAKCLLFLLFPIFYACQTAEQGSAYCLKASAIYKIDALALAEQFNGVILIAQDDVVLHYQSYGFSDIGAQKKLKLDNHFYIGSISKQITAVLVLRAMERGELSLSDKIEKYLPEISENWSKQVDIHQLLTHTHGIVAKDSALAFQPGTQFSYSQLGFGLLAEILERIQQKSFEELANSFFAESGLMNTYHPGAQYSDLLVIGYEEDDLGALQEAIGNPMAFVAAGGFVSSAMDLHQWNLDLHGNKYLSAKSMSLIKKHHATRAHPIFGEIDYGYGLLFNRSEQNLQIGALGYVPGFPSLNFYFPQTKVSLVVLGNTGRNLNDFAKTFHTHLGVLGLVRESCSE